MQSFSAEVDRTDGRQWGGKETVRSMPRAISAAVGAEPKMRSRDHEMVAEKLGAPKGVAMFAESGFVKKGKDSAGVARQSWGTIGKGENCQVGVVRGYASRPGSPLVDTRVFFPERWFEDDRAARRWNCRGPPARPFQPTPQGAAERFRRRSQQDCLPFKYLGADTRQGNRLDCIAAAAECLGKTAGVSLPKETLCGLRAPLTETKPSRDPGEPRSTRGLHTPANPPLSCEAFATGLPAWFWFKRTVADGAKGPIAYAFAKRRLGLARDGLPWKTVWVVIKRTVEKEPTDWDDGRNASCGARLTLFVWLRGMRWALAPCVGDTQSEVGMDHDDVRKDTGWNRQILTGLFAHVGGASYPYVGRTRPLGHVTSTETPAKNGLAPASIFDRGQACGGHLDSPEASSRLSFSSKKDATDGRHPATTGRSPGERHTLIVLENKVGK